MIVETFRLSAVSIKSEVEDNRPRLYTWCLFPGGYPIIEVILCPQKPVKGGLHQIGYHERHPHPQGKLFAIITLDRPPYVS